MITKGTMGSSKFAEPYLFVSLTKYMYPATLLLSTVSSCNIL